MIDSFLILAFRERERHSLSEKNKPDDKSQPRNWCQHYSRVRSHGVNDNNSEIASNELDTDVSGRSWLWGWICATYLCVMSPRPTRPLQPAVSRNSHRNARRIYLGVV